MSDTNSKATIWIVSRGGKESAEAANEAGQTRLGAHECLMVDLADFSALSTRVLELEAALENVLGFCATNQGMEAQMAIDDARALLPQVPA